MKKVLVLGGTIFIGYYTVKRLLENNCDVTIFHRGKHSKDIPNGINRIIGDRNNLSDFRNEFKKLSPDVVLDMRPITQADAEMVASTFRDITKRIVGISSCDVYQAFGVINGTEPEGTPIQKEIIAEDSPLRKNLYPHRNLSESMHDYDKILVENVYMNQNELSGTILRLPIVYGEKDYQHRLFPYLKRMDDNRPKILLDTITANWKSCRSYVGNVAEAIALSIVNDDATNQIYNVAEPYNFTEKDWISEIAKITNWKGDIAIMPEDKMAPAITLKQNLAIDSSKIRDQLGYKEPNSLNKALTNTIEWERSNPPSNISPQMFDYESEDKLLNEQLK